ncbi:MAG: DUF2332 domain-containing protein [Nostocoides sp.]
MTLADRFREHFTGEQHLYWHLARGLGDDIDAGGPTAQVVAGWEDAPASAVVQLRLLAGLFREVLTGRADELRPFYPCLAGSADPAGAWAVARPVVERAAPRLRSALEVAPQTNEVGRSVALLVGISHAVRAAGLHRVRLLEPGASAGLNLLADRFRFVGDGWSAGPQDSGLVVADVGAEGFVPEAFEVVSRRGCDLAPVDAATDEGALRLRSFVWPFHLERHRRLDAALAIARDHPVQVDAGGAADWLAAQLGSPAGEGALTVVWQSITAQYWPAEEIARVTAVIDDARSRMPLTRVAMEAPGAGAGKVTDHSADYPVVEVDSVAVARCDFHGPPVTLLA